MNREGRGHPFFFEILYHFYRILRKNKKVSEKLIKKTRTQIPFKKQSIFRHVYFEIALSCRYQYPFSIHHWRCEPFYLLRDASKTNTIDQVGRSNDIVLIVSVVKWNKPAVYSVIVLSYLAKSVSNVLSAVRSRSAKNNKKTDCH